MENKSIFEKLNSINVNEHVEKKNGLSYLSWAWAWAEVKKQYPTANYTIYERLTQYGEVNYFTDGKTAWVKTGVTIDGLEHIEMLPVMDYKNKSILLENITSFDVNKTIQRSLTKALARHGLGLYIYAGEDLPEDNNNSEKKATPRQVEIIEEFYTGELRTKLLSVNNVNSVSDLSFEKALELCQKISEYRQKNVTTKSTMKFIKEGTESQG